MGLRYRCLVLDHDDTAVNSTEHIHYPIYRELMAQKRPELEEKLDLNGFISMNNEKGVTRHYFEDLGFSEEEWKEAFEMWKNHELRKTIPDFYDGFIDILRKYRDDGGFIAVVSHSDEKAIRMHYSHFPEVMPDEVYGATGDGTKNKPYTWPLDQLMEKHGFDATDIVVVDDLMPGIEMAKKVGATTIGVGWSHNVNKDLKENCDYFCDKVGELEQYLYD